VVVDDLDMQISHVIRGDDHVNNTPRHIHILQALNANIPVYAHLPTVLNEQGEKMSKRQGAIGVLDYAKQGYLPEAVINYLARLGWSHGDDEFFTTQQLIAWFDLTHMGTSAGQHNPEKLLWLNAQHLKSLSNDELYARTLNFIHSDYLANYSAEKNHVLEAIEIYKQRSHTLIELAQNIENLAQTPNLQDACIKQGLAQSIKDDAHQQQLKNYLIDLIPQLQQLNATNQWQTININQALKELMQKHALKMPHVGMPLRWLLLGTGNTPSVDQIIYLIGATRVLKRLQGYIDVLN
jgi:glutamyl-tRNA synthetase